MKGFMPKYLPSKQVCVSDEFQTRYNFSAIYKLINLINHKIYIGQAKNLAKRLVHHKYDYKPTMLINRAIRKYGWDNFLIEIIEKINVKGLDKKEKFWINFYKSCNINIGYNLLSEGKTWRNFKHSKKTKKKMSEVKKNYYKNHCNPMFGKHHKKETKRKISETRIRKGIKLSPEIIKQIALKRKGKPLLLTRKSILQINLHTGKIIKEWKGVRKTNRFFKSSSSGSNISNVLRGQTKSAYGFFWKYK